jgi:class 3 adenylate cyclase/tetratricopeptide (TPR) repeat protein
VHHKAVPVAIWSSEGGSLDALTPRPASLDSAFMPLCSNCGEANPAPARFCSSCGAALQPPATPSREVRKPVTVIFCDLAGSTSLGERLDSESVRRIMSRFYEEMRAAVERHGGRVEKFVGDAVMAVFGLPDLHEDDALRACRSAVDMRDALSGLNAELERRWGVRLEARVGVNTGEVVAGDPAGDQAFLVGDAVNVAARLEQAAESGEILLGPVTSRLVAHAATLEEVEPLALKGKARPVRACRLIDVTRDAPAIVRRLDAPIVGRHAELAALEAEFEQAREQRRCRLMTVIGPAGVGKSRVTAEFVRRLGDRAQVLQGRCLPYGEGITFWPLAEVVKGAARIDPDDSRVQARAKIRSLVPDGDDAAAIVDRVAEALGLSDGAAYAEEIFWATRRLLEGLAEQRPVVVVLDDIQWAEKTMLDLIEYLAATSRDAPLLLVCLARTELREVRPSLGDGDTTVLSVEPLTEGESHQLVGNLLGDVALAPADARRITASADGNPLFVEELLRMLVDDGVLERAGGRWRVAGDLSAISVPPTVEALLRARLDRLTHDEEATVGHASVIGQEFWPAAVSHLLPEPLSGAIGRHLASLTLKELVRPHGRGLAGEDGFRFVHILIRDVAYSGLLKEVRSDLHERLADWLASRAGERFAEWEEICGYHLEQAYGYRRTLGPVGQPERALARRAAGYLGAAGRRALARGDIPAAANLLRRAARLVPDGDSARIEVLLDLIVALSESGALPEAADVASRAIALAVDASDRRLELHARIEHARWIELYTSSEISAGELIALAERALPLFAEHGDELGLTRALHLLGDVHLIACRCGQSAAAFEGALGHARRAGHQREVVELQTYLAVSHYWGPMSAPEAIEHCEDVLREARGQRYLETNVLSALAGLHAMRGDFSGARDLYRRSHVITEELGARLSLAAMSLFSGKVEALAGDAAAAERELRRSYEMLLEMGEKSLLSTIAAQLAEAVYEQGRGDEAERLTRISEEAAGPDDLLSQVMWRVTRAKVRAGAGALGEAEPMARAAVELGGRTDYLNLRGDAAMALAEVLFAAGRTDEAAASARSARAMYERKGNLVAAGISAERLLERGASAAS